MEEPTINKRKNVSAFNLIMDSYVRNMTLFKKLKMILKKAIIMAIVIANKMKMIIINLVLVKNS